MVSYLTLDEAFRIALGQVLFYGHIRFDTPPGLMILLNTEPDAKRLELASRYEIAVIVEHAEGEFSLLNEDVAPALRDIFLEPAAAEQT